MGIEIPISRIKGKWKAEPEPPGDGSAGRQRRLQDNAEEASRKWRTSSKGSEAPRVSPLLFAHLSVWRRSRYTIAMTDGLILHPDNKTRCWWPGTDPFYVAYHDTEWGVPEFDDRALFEKLILDGFQAGLSWITILRKRENFRRAFAGFDPGGDRALRRAQVETLMLDSGHRPQSREDHWHHRGRPSVAGHSGAGRLLGLSVGACRRAARPEQRENARR